MAQTAVIKIKLRRGTLAQWQAANPVLLQGEVGLVHDGTYPVGFVIGNGTQVFNDLWASNLYKFTPDANWQQALTAVNVALTNAIQSEANTRAAADITLTNNLATESQTRINADASLQGQINGEASTRAAADTALGNQILAVDSALTATITDLENNIQDWYGSATNAGDLLVFDPTAGTFMVLTAGANGEILSIDTAEPLGVKWTTAPTGVGDMTKAEYDPDNDGVVVAADVAYSVDWADVTNKPAVIGDMTKAVYDTDDDGVVDAAEREQFRVLNKTGATLTKGTIVYLKSSSSSAQFPEVLKADATTEPTSSKTIGAVFQDIPNDQAGYIITSGQVHNLNTSAYTVGAKLWLATTPGLVTTTPPAWPNHTVFIGHVTRSQTNNGGILYAIQNGYELEELHDVVITTGTLDSYQLLRWDGDKWVNDTVENTLGYTPADVNDLANYELVILPGTTSQYWRGDKTWQTLNKAAVGLSNVDNTSDLGKPVSTATQAALNAKQDTLVSGTTIKTLEGQSLLGSGNIDLTKADVGLSNVDNTSDANKPISTATQTALNGKENTIAAGTTGQYWRGDKSWQTLDKNAVGLSNVDNTSDLNKPISTAVQTALNGKENTLTKGNLTESTSNVLTITGGTGAVIGSGLTIQVKQASGIQSGFLSSTDWTTFNNKQAAGNYITALTGDVTASGPGSAASTIANGAVSLGKMANLAAGSIIGNNTGSPATPLALTGTQVTAMLDLFSSTLKGLTPPSGGGTTNFLRADGTWAAPPGGSGGITSLNGLTGSTQTFTNDTNVTIVSTGTAHAITWSGTLADSRIASASTWNSKIGGSGTTNQLAYFTASGTIASLSTATYPSLTELSYVKGVTSAVQTQLNGKEATITAGTTGQYWRGDKTWQTLDKNAVGLGNVDNTSDLNKPISTATQTALNGKEPTISAYSPPGATNVFWRGDKTWQIVDKDVVGLADVDNTADLDKPISTATQTALNGKQAVGNYITALTGDVTASGPGSVSSTIAAGAVSLAKMANLAANSIIGNNTGASATPIALTTAQVTAMLNAFTSTLKGLVPASGGGTTNFLRADGTWAAPAGGGGGITAIGTIDSATKAANGAVISGSNLIMQTADGSNPGLVSTAAQTFSGVKTFSSAPAFSTMTAGSILFAGTSGALTQNNGQLFWDNTGTRFAIGTASPTSKLDVRAGTLSATITRGFNVEGTMPTSYSFLPIGFRAEFTSAGTQSNNNFPQWGGRVALNAGYTGSASTAAIVIANNAAGTMGNIVFNGTSQGNTGIRCEAIADTTGHNYGHAGWVRFGAVSIGGLLRAGNTTSSQNKNGAKYIGAVGIARNDTAMGSVSCGGYFGLDQSGDPTFENAALIANNADAAYPIFLARDGGFTKWSIADGGHTIWGDAVNMEFNTSTGTKIGTATTQKIGFWNAAPIVQPTTAVASATRTGGGGTALTDSDTFDGYTIAQVVKALRNMGALA